MAGNEFGATSSRRAPGLLLMVLAILSVPALALWLGSPILWRDSDGFWQIAGKPGVGTILHWPPLYPFAARIPLALGALWEAIFQGGSGPGANWFSKPVITDTGLSFLVLCQHVLLVGAWAFLVFRIAADWRWRIGIALWFALQSWAYGFAQTIGSESLSNTLLLVFFGAGLEVLKNGRRRWWIAAGVFLWLAILTRHINAVFAAALPGTILLLTLLGWTEVGRMLPRALLRMGIAIAVGVGAILAASATVHVAARMAEIPYRSRMGYTFQWRMNYLLKFSAEERHEILAALSKKTPNPLAAAGILAVEGGIRPDGTWDTSHVNDTMVTLVDQSYPELSAKEREAVKDEHLNAIARKFLSAPEARFWPSVLRDLLQSMRTSYGEIAREPLMTTDFLRNARHEKRFARIAGLRSLQGGQVESELPEALRAYLHLGAVVPLWFCVSAVLVLSAFAMQRSREVHASASWAISLVLTGILVTFLNVSLTFQAPRFLLPVAAAIATGLPIALMALFNSRKREALLQPAKA